jgi:hypothetical protein
MQRGMPRESSPQLSGCVCTVPEQHLSVAMHELVDRRQTEPAGEHEFPLSQRPIAAPGAIEQ